MASIDLHHLEKIYPTGQRAVSDLNLHIADGEYLTLVGPSGCGKTTTLRLIAGLEEPTAGQVLLDGTDVTGWPPHRRDVALVFQNPVLYPHLSVRGNLAFPMQMKGATRQLIADRIAHVARLLGLDTVLDRRPDQLSGGQQQRVALGRALVRQPRAFLLDEPLSQLDAPLRLQMRTELKQLHRQIGATILHVTHDQEEAFSLGDRVAVLADGRLQQVAPPQVVYLQPANLTVAQFMGSPPMNLFPCTIHEENGKSLLRSPFFQLQANGPFPSRPVLLGIRPHDILLAADHEADCRGRVDLVQPLGSETIINLRLETGQESQTLTAVVPASTILQHGNVVPVRLPPAAWHLFDSRGIRLAS
jgi:ABC-type sugar transport system ATPase subunit